jgi:tetratricopeptide (TPR) repeat protein
MNFHDEAELRFVQAMNLDPGHTEAMVSAALCCAVRCSPAESLPLLERAQALRPFDARIGLLLTQAARAVQQQGLAVRVRAAMPDEAEVEDPRGIEDLSRVIERDPEFLDALLSIPVSETPRPVYVMLLHTLEKTLARQPERAELHFHCGQVLERLGQHDAALAESERAVAINPRFVRGLIELARLYRTRNRCEDAAKHLEQAVAFGAEYADVYCLLGHLYREQGEIGRAREAYRHALTINAKYQAAQEALAGLPVEAS